MVEVSDSSIESTEEFLLDELLSEEEFAIITEMNYGIKLILIYHV